MRSHARFQTEGEVCNLACQVALDPPSSFPAAVVAQGESAGRRLATLAVVKQTIEQPSKPKKSTAKKKKPNKRQLAEQKRIANTSDFEMAAKAASPVTRKRGAKK